MNNARKTTICFDQELYRALKFKAAKTGMTISALVNEAVGVSLSEDVIDLQVFEERKQQRRRKFSSFVRDLRRAGH